MCIQSIDIFRVKELWTCQLMSFPFICSTLYTYTFYIFYVSTCSLFFPLAHVKCEGELFRVPPIAHLTCTHLQFTWPAPINNLHFPYLLIWCTKHLRHSTQISLRTPPNLHQIYTNTTPDHVTPSTIYTFILYLYSRSFYVNTASDTSVLFLFHLLRVLHE